MLRRIISWFFPNYYSFLRDKTEIKQVKLIRRSQVARDTVELTFEIPHNLALGLECGQHIVCYNGNNQRKYTPTANTNGSFDLVVKVYPNGVVGGHLDTLNIGDSLHISGPVGQNLYLGNGCFSLADRVIESDLITFICAGSGITPIYAILGKMVENRDVHIDAKILFVNKTIDDIILRDKLDSICSGNPNMNIRYSLTQPPDANWSGLVGRPTPEMIGDINSGIVVICGSHDFNSCIGRMCMDLGVRREKIIIF